MIFDAILNKYLEWGQPAKIKSLHFEGSKVYQKCQKLGNYRVKGISVEDDLRLSQSLHPSVSINTPAIFPLQTMVLTINHCWYSWSASSVVSAHTMLMSEAMNFSAPNLCSHSFESVMVTLMEESLVSCPLQPVKKHCFSISKGKVSLLSISLGDTQGLGAKSSLRIK